MGGDEDRPGTSRFATILRRIIEGWSCAVSPSFRFRLKSFDMDRVRVTDVVEDDPTAVAEGDRLKGTNASLLFDD